MIPNFLSFSIPMSYPRSPVVCLPSYNGPCLNTPLHPIGFQDSLKRTDLGPVLVPFDWSLGGLLPYLESSTPLNTQYCVSNTKRTPTYPGQTLGPPFDDGTDARLPALTVCCPSVCLCLHVVSCSDSVSLTSDWSPSSTPSCASGPAEVLGTELMVSF